MTPMDAVMVDACMNTKPSCSSPCSIRGKCIVGCGVHARGVLQTPAADTCVLCTAQGSSLDMTCEDACHVNACWALN